MNKLTTHNSQLTTHNSQLTTHNLQLTTYNLQLTTYNLQLTTYNSQLIDKVKNERSSGFTLIELLIVVVVISTLMGLVFRLAGVGGSESARNTTITRMQKLEFALSGYYAAFGSYPPVPLHGSRDIFCGVNGTGIQYSDSSKNRSETLSDKDGGISWAKVQAACMSQPIAAEFPYCPNKDNKDLQDTRKSMIALYQAEYQRKGKTLSSRLVNWDGKMLEDPGILNRLVNPNEKATWHRVQAFKFGVLSFLLPRYLFMLEGDNNLYDTKSNAGALQWQSQNDIASIFDFKDGKPAFDNWSDLKNKSGLGSTAKSRNTDKKEYLLVANQPSQAVCARWIQALDGIVFGGRMFFGVDTSEDHDAQTSFSISSPETSAIYAPNRDSDNDSYANLYKLDRMTVRDGWGHDLYYYSPPPYQGYRVWSGGANGKTIPPWIDTSKLTDKTTRETAAKWMADDIVHLSGNAK